VFLFRRWMGPLICVQLRMTLGSTVIPARQAPPATPCTAPEIRQRPPPPEVPCRGCPKGATKRAQTFQPADWPGGGNEGVILANETGASP